MSRLDVNSIRHTAGSADNITLDGSKNVTCENNLQVDGNLTVTGTIPADKLTGALPAISGASLTGISSGRIGRNIAVNGAMNVAQRSTSSTGNGYKSVDRFQIQFGGHTGVAQAQVALASSDTGPWEKGFRNCFKITNASTADETNTSAEARITYNIEGQDMAGSGWEYNNTSSNLTVSCWFKSSVAETFYMVLRSRDGTNQGYCTPITLSANTWTKFTKTVPGAANIQIDNDAGDGFAIHIYLFLGSSSTTSGHTNNAWGAYNGSDTTPDFETSGSWFAGDASSTFQMTGFQVEAGDSATEFEHRSFSDELMKCRRYCQASSAGDNDFLFGPGYEGGDGSFYMPVMLNPPMRAAPSMTVHSGNWKQVGDGGQSSEYTGAMSAYDQQPGPIHTSLLFWKDTDYPSSKDGRTQWMRAGENSTVVALEAEI